MAFSSSVTTTFKYDNWYLNDREWIVRHFSTTAKRLSPGGWIERLHNSSSYYGPTMLEFSSSSGVNMAEVTVRQELFVSGSLKRICRLGTAQEWGRRCPCKASPFKVCAILLENSGKLVMRKELRAGGSGRGQLFGLTLPRPHTAIPPKIRVALGDEADNPRFVETMPRKGLPLQSLQLTFLLPKAPRPGGPAIEAAQEEEVGKPFSPFRRWMAIAFLSVAAIAVLLWPCGGIRRGPRKLLNGN